MVCDFCSGEDATLAWVATLGSSYAYVQPVIRFPQSLLSPSPSPSHLHASNMKRHGPERVRKAPISIAI